MNMYDTYIFDLDGTLLSTLNDLAASCNYALEHNGMPQRSIDEVRQFVGNGVKKLMERAIPDGLSNPLFDKTYQSFRYSTESAHLDCLHRNESLCCCSVLSEYTNL